MIKNFCSGCSYEDNVECIYCPVCKDWYSLCQNCRNEKRILNDKHYEHYTKYYEDKAKVEFFIERIKNEPHILLKILKDLKLEKYLNIN